MYVNFWYDYCRTSESAINLFQRCRKCTISYADMVLNLKAFRDIAKGVIISVVRVHKVLKDESFHSLQLIEVHKSCPMNFQQRMVFVNGFCLKRKLGKLLCIAGLFSLTSQGHANLHSLYYWEFENSYRQFVVHALVWCGIHNGNIIGPYFTHSTF